MPQNGILHEGVAALAEAFKSNPNLKVGSLAVRYTGFELSILSNGSLLYTNVDTYVLMTFW